jgi:C1A family cysteine protease
MSKYTKGCLPPKDLARRRRLSMARNPEPQCGAVVLPTSYDSRAKGLVPPVKNQAQCGCCWCFSGIFAAEMAAIVAGLGTAATVNEAEQSILDCGSNGGCNGDWPETALEQIKNSGVANTAQYPYAGGPTRTCKNVPHPNVVTNYGYVGSQDAVPTVAALKAAILQYKGISVAVAADDAFQAYTSGIFRDSGATEIDHAVGLVGWRTTTPRTPLRPAALRRATGFCGTSGTRRGARAATCGSSTARTRSATGPCGRPVPRRRTPIPVRLRFPPTPIPRPSP